MQFNMSKVCWVCIYFYILTKIFWSYYCFVLLFTSVVYVYLWYLFFFPECNFFNCLKDKLQNVFEGKYKTFFSGPIICCKFKQDIFSMNIIIYILFLILSNSYTNLIKAYVIYLTILRLKNVRCVIYVKTYGGGVARITAKKHCGQFTNHIA